MYRGDLVAAGVASERALVVAERCGDPSAMVAALRARQLVRSDPDGVEERAQLAEQMLAIGGSNPQTQMWAHLWHIDVMFQRGDLAGVTQQLQLLAWCADNVRGPEARWQLLRCQAALAQAQGRFDDALQLALASHAELAPTGNAAAFHVRNGLLATAGHHIGHDVSGSIAASGLVASTAQNHDFPTGGVILTIAPAFLLAAVGRLAEAAKLYRKLGPVADWRPMPHVVTVSYAFGILVAAALDAVDDVGVLRERLLRFRAITSPVALELSPIRDLPSSIWDWLRGSSACSITPSLTLTRPGGSAPRTVLLATTLRPSTSSLPCWRGGPGRRTYHGRVRWPVRRRERARCSGWRHSLTKPAGWCSASTPSCPLP